MIDAVKKIHDDAVEKQTASASDTEEKNAQFLVDQAERIAKYSKQVFGELEQLDELSKKLLTKYGTAARKDVKERSKKAIHLPREEAIKNASKVGHRMNDIQLAKSKIGKPNSRFNPAKVKAEEVEPEEQLDELSKETMKRYKGKAKFDAVHSVARDDIGRAKKRFSGLDAAKRLQKEEVEEQIDEKYIGFKKLEGKLAGKGVWNPGAVAASIGRKKYGAAKFNKAAHEHKKMKGMKAEEVNYIEEAMKQRIIDKVMELRNKDK